MGEEIFLYLCKYFKENGGFTICQKPKIRCDIYTNQNLPDIFLVVYYEDRIFDIARVLFDWDGDDTKYPVSSMEYDIVTKIKGWYYTAKIKEGYFQ